MEYIYFIYKIFDGFWLANFGTKFVHMIAHHITGMQWIIKLRIVFDNEYAAESIDLTFKTNYEILT